MSFLIFKTTITFLLVLKFFLCKADDLFASLLQQSTFCFDLIHDETCNTSVHNVYQSPYITDDLNFPDTKFFLFTSKNPDKAEPLHQCGGRLPQGSDFDPTAKTVIFIHGWLDGVCRTAFFREAKQLLLKRDNYNVILVDWTWGNMPDYARAAANCIPVGDQLGFLIKNIIEQMNVSGDNFHLIGHSFGVASASFAAKFILKWNKDNKLRRITGLDPALAPFKHSPPKGRIFHEDAKFVDIIHSNGGTCFPLVHATSEPLGHADFYPNGGVHQESCYTYMFESILKGDLLSTLAHLYPPLCSHMQALQFFKVTIPKNNSYIGVLCNSYEDFKSGKCQRCCRNNAESCAVAGMDAEFHFPFINEPRKVRKYYFDTSNLCPFPEDYEQNINKDCLKIRELGSRKF